MTTVLNHLNTSENPHKNKRGFLGRFFEVNLILGATS